jgi:hypothetical protein
MDRVARAVAVNTQNHCTAILGSLWSYWQMDDPRPKGPTRRIGHLWSSKGTRATRIAMGAYATATSPAEMIERAITAAHWDRAERCTC